MPVKDPQAVRRGQLGARKRWGPPRVVRLDDLTPEQRTVVRALVDMVKAAPVSETSGAAQEARRDTGEPSAA